MKKIIFPVMISALVVLSGCGGGGETSSEPETGLLSVTVSGLDANYTINERVSGQTLEASISGSYTFKDKLDTGDLFSVYITENSGTYACSAENSNGKMGVSNQSVAFECGNLLVNGLEIRGISAEFNGVRIEFENAHSDFSGVSVYAKNITNGEALDDINSAAYKKDFKKLNNASIFAGGINAGDKYAYMVTKKIGNTIVESPILEFTLETPVSLNTDYDYIVLSDLDGALNHQLVEEAGELYLLINGQSKTDFNGKVLLLPELEAEVYGSSLFVLSEETRSESSSTRRFRLIKEKITKFFDSGSIKKTFNLGSEFGSYDDNEFNIGIFENPGAKAEYLFDMNIQFDSGDLSEESYIKQIVEAEFKSDLNLVSKELSGEYDKEIELFKKKKGRFHKLYIPTQFVVPIIVLYRPTFEGVAEVTSKTEGKFVAKSLLAASYKAEITSRFGEHEETSTDLQDGDFQFIPYPVNLHIEANGEFAFSPRIMLGVEFYGFLSLDSFIGPQVNVELASTANIITPNMSHSVDKATLSNGLSCGFGVSILDLDSPKLDLCDLLIDKNEFEYQPDLKLSKLDDVYVDYPFDIELLIERNDSVLSEEVNWVADRPYEISIARDQLKPAQAKITPHAEGFHNVTAYVDQKHFGSALRKAVNVRFDASETHCPSYENFRYDYGLTYDEISSMKNISFKASLDHCAVMFDFVSDASANTEKPQYSKGTAKYVDSLLRHSEVNYDNRERVVVSEYDNKYGLLEKISVEESNGSSEISHYKVVETTGNGIVNAHSSKHGPYYKKQVSKYWTKVTEAEYDYFPEIYMSKRVGTETNTSHYEGQFDRSEVNERGYSLVACQAPQLLNNVTVDALNRMEETEYIATNNVSQCEVMSSHKKFKDGELLMSYVAEKYNVFSGGQEVCIADYQSNTVECETLDSDKTFDVGLTTLYDVSKSGPVKVRTDFSLFDNIAYIHDSEFEGYAPIHLDYHAVALSGMHHWVRMSSPELSLSKTLTVDQLGHYQPFEVAYHEMAENGSSTVFAKGLAKKQGNGSHYSESLSFDEALSVYRGAQECGVVTFKQDKITSAELPLNCFNSQGDALHATFKDGYIWDGYRQYASGTIYRYENGKEVW